MRNLSATMSIVLSLFFAGLSHPAGAGIQTNGAASHRIAVTIGVPTVTAFPSHIAQGIQQAASAWNASGCNVGCDDFPKFGVTSGPAPNLNVAWHTGSSFAEGLGINVCGAMINPGGRGSSATLHLWRQVMVGHILQDCYPMPAAVGSTMVAQAIAADAVAHELGHYLGLGHPICSVPSGVPIMTPRSYTASQVNSTTRSIQQTECSKADDINHTGGSEDLNEDNQDSNDDPDAGTQPPSPILLDLDRNQFHLTGTDDPAVFDIDADGFPEAISWTKAGQADGFLVLDRSGNGQIDNGSELFGNATPLADGSIAAHGYEALIEFDFPAHGGNFNGVIDSGDAIFDSLGVWLDDDHDGVSSLEEQYDLEELGIVRLSLEYRVSDRVDQHGNRFFLIGRGWLRGARGDERQFTMADVYFVRK